MSQVMYAPTPSSVFSAASGQLYSAINGACPVQQPDIVSALAAGWSTTNRKLVSKMRALLAQAQVGQPTPATAQPLIQPSAHPGNAVAVAKGQSFSNGGNNYAAIVGGVTGTGTAPVATTTGALVDGTVQWYYMGPTFTSSPLAPTFTNVAAALGGGSVEWTNTNGTRVDGGSRIRDTSNFLITGSAFVDGGVGGAIIGSATGLLTQVTFMTDATTFQVVASGGSTPNAQFYVNGVPLTLAYGSGAVQSQSAFFWNFVFPTKAVRMITCEMVSPLAFFGVITSDATSKVFAPSFANSFRMAITGSSYISGSAQHPVTQSLGWGTLTAKLLNCSDYWQDAQGAGTGYLAGAPTLNYAAPGRFNALVAYNPDVVMIAGGGINDRNVGGITVATEQAAVLDYLQKLRLALPNALIMVIGAEAGATGPLANIFQMELAVQQAVAQFADPYCIFIPQSSGSAQKAWVSGTGTTAAPNASGNSDIYIGPDTIHPVQVGCFYYAQQSANGIIAAVNTLNA